MKKTFKLLSILIILSVLIFGCEKQDDESSAPSINTLSLTDVTISSAYSGGTNIKDNGASITEKGICWGKDENPTINNDKIAIGGGTDDFTAQLTNLTENTTYYVRAYAVNRMGVSYGAVVTFNTRAYPVLLTPVSENVSLTSFDIKATATSVDGSITEQGICWSKQPMPDVNDNKITSEPGAGITAKVSDVASGDIYYVRTYVINDVGTFYSNEIVVTTQAIDYDGNIYNTVKIGNQLWMVENLKVTHYRNGDYLEYVGTGEDWSNSPEGVFCDYKDYAPFANVYGRLYNRKAITDVRNICPEGWRLPKQEDWTELFNYLGGAHVAGGKLKEVGTSHWASPNTGATNSVGFTALPGGYRNSAGFFDLGKSFSVWSDPSSQVAQVMFYDGIHMGGTSNDVNHVGFSIRCIK